MGMKVSPKTLSGFMELPPQEQMLFEQIRRRLEEAYASFGFFALDTPVLEASEVLLAKAGGETEKQVYRFEKGDTDMTMRFDLTVPLAKYVAKNYGNLTFPFKRYAIGKVYRGERAQRGRFREFYQADIDIIGDGSLSIVNDAEIPAVICAALQGLGLSDFTIRINNRKVLGGLFRSLGLGAELSAALVIVDKLEKIGRGAVCEELQKLGLPQAGIDSLLDLLGAQGENEEILARLGEMAAGDEAFLQGVQELSDVLSYAAAFGVPKETLRIDLTIARGLDYYTGTVYETTFNPHPEIGSICSGGRYDNLAEFYTDKKLPGVGMSIGLTRLFYILNERGYLSGDFSAPADALVIPMSADLEPAVAVSAHLREAGIRTQIYLEARKFKHKIGYADKLAIPYAIFLGEDEIASGKLAVKDMRSGEQQTLSPEEAIRLILSDVERRREERVIRLDK